MTCAHETGRVAKVGLARYRVGEAPLKMMTMALGSCLGIVLFDPIRGIGALAHVMHPRRARLKNKGSKAKFVDSAIAVMIDRMVARGARASRIVAKLFGGARMFEPKAGVPGVIQIGDENIAAAREELRKRRIPVVAEAVGGTKGRTIIFDVCDGSVVVRDALGNEEIR
jgi:chemotaxis protein CheD